MIFYDGILRGINFKTLKSAKFVGFCSLLAPPWEDVQEAQQRFFGAASQWVLGPHGAPDMGRNALIL
jgi:hypothetical protein